MNLKYLTITVGSIFLALGIGIFIGLVISTGNVVETQTGDIVTQIEEQFAYLRDENKKNREEIERVQETNSHLDYALGAMSSNIINAQLEGRNIAVVNLNDEEDNSFVKNILERGGANITSITHINSSFYTDGDKIKDEMNLSETVSEDESIYNYLGHEFSQVLLNGQPSNAVVQLVERGYISLEGDYSFVPDEILIIGGYENEKHRNGSFTNVLLEAVKNSNKIAVGAETSDVKNSDIPLFKEYGLSTVDNIDQHIGKLSLVITLKGVKGNYGEKDKDDISVPDITLLD